MIKIGLIGAKIDKILLEDYPLKLDKVALINGEGAIEGVLDDQAITAYLEGQEEEPGFGISVVSACLSLVLQGMRSYDEVVFSVALVPVYPPAQSMQAVTRALQWMQEAVTPDFLLITFSSPEPKHQMEQSEWLGKLHETGCEVIAPVGAPPSFPSSLQGVVAVSDKGFLQVGFDNVQTDVVIEDDTAIIYHHGAWHRHGLSTELASAIELKNRMVDRLSKSPVPDTSLVLLPDLDSLVAIQMDLDGEDFGQAPEKQGLLARGKSYFKSLLSRIITPTGRVPAFVKEIRQVSCNGDDREIVPCPFREESKKQPESYVCGACGCGDRESVLVGGKIPRYGKLDYPYVTCPASMPGFSNYIPSAREARPNSRKVAIEQKYGEDTLDEAIARQSALGAKLQKRLDWLHKL